MKRKLKPGSVFKWIFLLLFFGFFFGPSNFELWRQKWIISQALAHAKSVRLEHYRGAIESFGAEQIIAAKELAPEDFHRVADAFPIVPDIGCPLLVLGCIFNPHHRIIITDASGNVTTIKVCFECDHISITHGDEKLGNAEITPFIWMYTLRNFFASEGMPNSPDLYGHIHLQYAETNQAPSVAH